MAHVLAMLAAARAVLVQKIQQIEIEID